MPLRTRLAPVAALATVLAFSGCDSNSSNSALEELDGTYTVAELVFDPVTASLPDADVAARLRASSTRLQIFGDDGDVLFQSQFDDAGGSRRTDLTATASRGRITFTAVTVEDEEELADLFLPASFSLTYNVNSPRDLEGDLALTNVNLQNFDPDLYQDQTAVRGTLRVRLSPDLDD